MKTLVLAAVLFTALSVVPSSLYAVPETYYFFGLMKPPGCDIRENAKTCVIKVVCDDEETIDPGTNLSIVAVNYSSAVAVTTHSFMALPVDANPVLGATIVTVYYTDDGSDALIVL